MILYTRNKSKKKKKTSPKKKELTKTWQALKQKIEKTELPGRRLETKSPVSSVSDPLLKVLALNAHRSISHFPSAQYKGSEPKKQIRYTGELAERELAAQKEIERKRGRVAPLYNKGGLQYISDDTDLTTIGKKV